MPQAASRLPRGPCTVACSPRITEAPSPHNYECSSPACASASSSAISYTEHRVRRDPAATLLRRRRATSIDFACLRQPPADVTGMAGFYELARPRPQAEAC